LGVRLSRLANQFSVLISNLGAWWALGGQSCSQLGRMHELYLLSIQWFLHSPLNGWFVLGVLGFSGLACRKARFSYA